MTKSLLRKIAAIVALITAAVSISSCSKNKIETDDRSDMPTLLIGIDYYKPLVYRDYDGKFVGMDVELAEEVCRHIGYKARYVYMDWSDKNSYLLRGDIDCIWCCFYLSVCFQVALKWVKVCNFNCCFVFIINSVLIAL